jgi:hypothetical protein
MKEHRRERMATKETATSPPTTPPNAQPGEIKLAEDAEKKLSKGADPLTAKQVGRAAVEAFQFSKPQPTPEEVEAVIDKLTEVDEKGELKQKFSKPIDAAKAAVSAANELRKAA